MLRSSFATRVIMANKASVFKGAWLVIGLVGAGMISMFGFGCLIVYSRPTKVMTDGVLVSNDGMTPVSVNLNHGAADVRLIASWADPKKYDTLTHASYAVPTLDPQGAGNGTLASREVSGWKWYSTSRMVLYLTGNAIALVDQGHLQVLEEPTATLGFNGANGENYTIGNPEGFEPGVDEEVAEKCAAVNCPLSMCTARLSVSTYFYETREVLCDGSKVWAWPEGVSLAADYSQFLLMNSTAALAWMAMPDDDNDDLDGTGAGGGRQLEPRQMQHQTNSLVSKQLFCPTVMLNSNINDMSAVNTLVASNSYDYAASTHWNVINHAGSADHMSCCIVETDRDTMVQNWLAAFNRGKKRDFPKPCKRMYNRGWTWKRKCKTSYARQMIAAIKIAENSIQTCTTPGYLTTTP